MCTHKLPIDSPFCPILVVVQSQTEYALHFETNVDFIVKIIEKPPVNTYCHVSFIHCEARKQFHEIKLI
jgi:hypothetical protein